MNAALAVLGLLLSAARSAPPAPTASQDPPPDEKVAFRSLVLPHPCPRSKARFGGAVALGDFDADGRRDVAVGAEGEGAVYRLRQVPPFAFELEAVLTASGPARCPVPQDGQARFGAFLAAGDLDGDAADELVVAAPRRAGAQADAGAVHVFGLAQGPLTLLPDAASEGLFGQGLGIGDLDGDGAPDLAVSAPLATAGGGPGGRVVVHFGPLAPDGRRLVIENPAPVTNGNFGHGLAVDDWDGDGDDDLVVVAIGNTVGETALAGEIFVFPGPVSPADHVSLVDPVPVPGDIPRFGMSLAVAGPRIAVGAPRKDWRGIQDVGLGIQFLGPTYSVSLHPHPFPFPNAVLGFRVAFGDFLGDGRPDLAVASLPLEGTPPDGAPGAPGAPEGPEAVQAMPNRGLFVWETGGAGPPFHLLAAPDSKDHFPQGLAAGQLIAGGRDELVLGDATWDAPGTGRNDDTGRVVVYFRIPVAFPPPEPAPDAPGGDGGR